jgi:hypothetical protein
MRSAKRDLGHLPSALEMVESAGNAPASPCLQGKGIACLPRPLGIHDIRFAIYDIGRLPRCRPEQAEFWRLCRVLTRSLSKCGVRNAECGACGWLCGSFRTPHSAIRNRMVRLPGVAPGHPPWRGDILLLNHSRRKVKGPGGLCFTLPARAISTKNKHLLLSCDTNPRFHGGSFGVWGHTSCEALKL